MEFLNGTRTRPCRQGGAPGYGGSPSDRQSARERPIFLAITSWASTDVRCILARRVAVNAFALLIISIFVGSHILAIFGISLPIVQVG
ncbi:MAG: MarC family protein, partial [Candidatus Binatia bacterium]